MMSYILLAVLSLNDPGIVMWSRVIAATCVVITLATTLVINVPINKLTGKWNITDHVEKWTRMRTRWHFFQGIRGMLFLVSFILLAVALKSYP